MTMLQMSSTAALVRTKSHRKNQKKHSALRALPNFEVKRKQLLLLCHQKRCFHLRVDEAKLAAVVAALEAEPHKTATLVHGLEWSAGGQSADTGTTVLDK